MFVLLMFMAAVGFIDWWICLDSFSWMSALCGLLTLMCTCNISRPLKFVCVCVCVWHKILTFVVVVVCLQNSLRLVTCSCDFWYKFDSRSSGERVRMLYKQIREWLNFHIRQREHRHINVYERACARACVYVWHREREKKRKREEREKKKKRGNGERERSIITRELLFISP